MKYEFLLSMCITSGLCKVLIFCWIWFTTTFCESAGSKMELKMNFSQVNIDKNMHIISKSMFHKSSQLNESHRLHTDYCDRKNECWNNSTNRNCQCDNLCGEFNDCCENVNATETVFQSVYNRRQFECVFYNTLSGLKAALMVSKCSELWNEDKTKHLCEDMHSSTDILLNVPVSSYDKSIIFSNMYCAYCNNVTEFTYWTLVNTCPDNVTSECFLFNHNPTNPRHKRICGGEDIISTCSELNTSTNSADELVTRCELGQVLLIYDHNAAVYKNKFCAMCNGIDESSLFCDPPEDSESRISTGIPIYSYSQLVNFNTNQYLTVSEGDAVETPFDDCSSSDDELYDPVTGTCRKLYCPQMFRAVKGKCYQNKMIHDKSQKRNGKCAYIKLGLDEYKVLNDSSIYVFQIQKSVKASFLFRNGSDIYVCADMFEIRSMYFHFDVTESYITLCGLICSILSLVVTLTVYMLFSELRNNPGKNLISLMTALGFAQLTFLCSSKAAPNEKACKAFGIIVHYFFLASFTWMNVIAFDLFITFSRSFASNRSGNHVTTNFYRYSFYGWLVPIAIVVAALITDNVDIGNDQLKPRYGENICWISSKKALILFFMGPLGVFKLFDVAAFACTTVYISKSRRQGSMVRQYNFCSFLLYLKLSVIMGLTWLFAFVGAFLDKKITWYVFTIFNSLQGVFIALSFLCTKRVYKLVHRKLKRRRNADSTTGTLLSQLKRS